MQAYMVISCRCLAFMPCDIYAISFVSGCGKGKTSAINKTRNSGRMSGGCCIDLLGFSLVLF